MYKKGLSLAAGATAVLLIIIIGVTAVVGISINSQIQSQGISYTQTGVNETSVAFTNNTYSALAVPYAISITSIGNASMTIGSANYTLLANTSASSVQMLYYNSTSTVPENATGFLNGNYWVMYDYNLPNDAYRAAGNSTLGIQQVTSQMTLVGLIVVMAIVIGLLWSSFGRTVTASI